MFYSSAHVCLSISWQPPVLRYCTLKLDSKIEFMHHVKKGCINWLYWILKLVNYCLYLLFYVKISFSIALHTRVRTTYITYPNGTWYRVHPTNRQFILNDIVGVYTVYENVKFKVRPLSMQYLAFDALLLFWKNRFCWIPFVFMGHAQILMHCLFEWDPV